jgi:threonine aldolase
MPEVMEALARVNTDNRASYGEDEVCEAAAQLIRTLLDADAVVKFTASGTAANALSLASLAQPFEAVICHEHAHVATDETGAPGFFGAGLGLITAPGASGRIDAAVLPGMLSRPDDSHWQSPAALTVTNTTEFGARYSAADIAALAGPAKAAGLKLHLDGARMANAVAGGFDIRCLPKLGFDVVVLGGTKAGSTPTEAIVILNRDLAHRFGARLKHAGQLTSKARYLAAPWIGMLETDAWSVRAGHANAMAQRLAALSPFRVTHPVEANAVFVEMDEPALHRLHAAGWHVYRFIDGSVRFMCSWATTPELVDEFGTVLKGLV